MKKDKIKKSFKKFSQNPNFHYWITAILAFVLSGAYVGFGIWSKDYNGLKLLSTQGVSFGTILLSIFAVVGVFIVPSLIVKQGMDLIFDKNQPPTILGRVWKVFISVLFTVGVMLIFLFMSTLVRGDVSSIGDWKVTLKDELYFLGVLFPAFTFSYADAIKSSITQNKEIQQKEEEYKQKEYSLKQGILLRDERIKEQKRTIRKYEEREQRLYKTVAQKDKKIESLEEKLERHESENKDLRNQLRQYEQYQPMINLVKKIFKK